MTIDLSKQVVLVTGGSRGIGAAIVQALLPSGAQIALHYHQQQEKAQALARGQDQIKLFQADLTQASAPTQLMQQVIEHFGRIDVLINNAGLVKSAGLEAPWEAWQDAWETTLQVNLIAAASLCKAALPHMIQQGSGRLIHIASRAAFRGDTPEYIAYAASKGGMVAMSRSLARYYGKQGITSYVVAPGFTRTDMAQEFIDQYGAEVVVQDLALPRLTEASDVAPTVVFLASGHMDHATGCTIDINAGSYVR